MLANPRKPGHCLNCTFGGTCCLCRETAACYDHKYGSCNFSKLFANFEKYNSPCAPGKCFSGSYRAMPKPGFFLDTPKCHYNCTDNTDVENDTKVFVEAAQAQEDWWGSPDEPHVLFACSVLNAGLKQAHALRPVKALFPRPIPPSFPAVARACLWCLGARMWRANLP